MLMKYTNYIPIMTFLCYYLIDKCLISLKNGGIFVIPKYILLKEKLKQEILENKYSIDSNLPTEQQLAAMYQVSRATVRQALALLEEQGIIEKHWGSGNKIISKGITSKSNTIMVLLPRDDQKENSIYAEISSVLTKNKYEVEFFETQNSYQIERKYLQLLIEDVYCGLIIQPARSALPSVNSDLLQTILKRLIPAIFIASAPTNLYSPTIVGMDYYNKGYMMARRLINAGHKSLGGIFTSDDYASITSFRGFLDAIRDADLNIIDECFLFCPSSEPIGVNYRATSTINRFLSKAYNFVSAIYLDDDSITYDGTFPVYTCDLTPGKSLGRECGLTMLDIKKNGNGKSITIPYKD